MRDELPRLHAVTNDEVLALADFLERAAKIAAASKAVFHIRSGSLSGRRLSDLADATAVACGRKRLFVNDRADVATITNAAGLHLPSNGLSIHTARSIIGPHCWIGRSTHSIGEVARAADEGADYVFLGPIWPTASHPDVRPLGPDVLSKATGIPVIAIGGLVPERVRDCIEAGAYGVALISALWYAQDVTSTARALSLSFPP